GKDIPGTTNIRGLTDYPLGEQVRKSLRIDCRVGNDANQAMRAEVHFGMARGIRNVLGLTLGTGIGGALILGGKLWEGTRGGAGELGMTCLLRSPPGADISLDALIPIESKV